MATAGKLQSYDSLCSADTDVQRLTDDCIIEVPMQMKMTYEYENRTDTEVEITSKITKGFLTREKDLKMEKSEHSFDASMKTNVNFKIFKLEATANYSYRKEFYHEALTEKELTSGEEITAKYNVPPKSKLIRWQLVATVDNQTIGFGKFIDTTKDLTKDMKESILKGVAVIHLPRKIMFDRTKLRIKHKEKDKYLIPVLVEHNWDSLTLKANPEYYFQLEECSKGVRIKALSPTTANWCYVYSGVTGNLYLTKWAASDLTQMWIISKQSDLRNGDVVTFRNAYYETADLCYKDINRKTNVFCLDNSEDEWILEMAQHDCNYELPRVNCILS